MATSSRRIGNNSSKSDLPEKAGGVRVEKYPYIGIVKNNQDPTRTGRLQVWIPDFGGDENDPANWKPVSQASPYMGTTQGFDQGNDFGSVPHTYGMWMVPPDIGNMVIVLFIGGRTDDGYWIGCINPAVSIHMMPAIGGSRNVDFDSISDPNIKKVVKQGQLLPVAEYNTNEITGLEGGSVLGNKKPIHEIIFKTLLEQGLDNDTTRGVITSSAQRETPSNVFGISTPGRPIEDPANQVSRILGQDYTADEFENACLTRQGGHTFVMDDGSWLDEDQLIRLRTAKGHQILMHDTEETLYIANFNGSVWMEFTTDGDFNVFSAGGVAIRTEGDINLHTDENMNLHVEKALNIRAGSMQIDTGSFKVNVGTTFVLNSPTTNFKNTDFNVDSSGSISLKAGPLIQLNAADVKLRPGGGTSVDAPTLIPVNDLGDTSPTNGQWLTHPGKLKSIVNIAPTHEPFGGRTAPPPVAPPASPLAPTYSGSTDAAKGATPPVSGGGRAKDIRNQPFATESIGSLSKEETTALLAQVAKSESSGSYTVVNSIGFLGKYQLGYAALIDVGLVKKFVKSNSQLNNPDSWNNNLSKDEYLNSPAIQESAIQKLMNRNYNQLVRMGAVTAEDSSDKVGGMLMVAHLLGAGGANSWRKGGGGSDANGTTGDTYFAKGRYAVAVLGPQVQPTMQG